MREKYAIRWQGVGVKNFGTKKPIYVNYRNECEDPKAKVTEIIKDLQTRSVKIKVYDTSNNGAYGWLDCPVIYEWEKDTGETAVEKEINELWAEWEDLKTEKKRIEARISEIRKLLGR